MSEPEDGAQDVARETKAGLKLADGGRFAHGPDPRRNLTKPGTGRPPDWFQEKMRSFATKPEVLAYLERCLTDPETEEVFLKAWREVVDRGYGKAIQRQEVTGKDGGPVELTAVSPRERLRVELGRIAARRTAGRSP